MPRKRYKEFCWRCQILPDSEDAILLSYLQNHPFFSLKETILPLIKARWLLAALRNSGNHSSTDLEYLRRESINFLLRQIDEVCRDVGFNCTELGAIAPGISSGLIPLATFSQLSNPGASIATELTTTECSKPASLSEEKEPEDFSGELEFENSAFNLAGFDPAMVGPSFS
ncbi:MAG: hypothetical protein EAZ39_13930 [Oscillatoriales cyanobacterium]|uniref:hypothetical protein n=1 Tax=unclassified Microcoleus TaxID=2642155 RepID=UPI001D28CCB5|nr:MULTISPECIES: hypothetical protein [unclassified Microcoleus]TAG17368.1 MAG: hypothetical protein EAZ39_13930 [Oscillatoriales cyanobacterium]MCC3433934.1 hypothetical protein [Microcoleus sp. PH2017_05_CCC_O_A]MCC3583001.1 hypothetical protein [Microcoleus sp. PH2017_30_WIL_O_A]TAG45464.1 MAG: hypothetical protein EAZ33_07250 [Oscillatoriales cyanobacterium]TAG60614.1 MAG: hypothetical protein EAZ28_06585 [Oscillatoriales cyanobacterium]